MRRYLNGLLIEMTAETIAEREAEIASALAVQEQEDEDWVGSLTKTPCPVGNSSMDSPR